MTDLKKGDKVHWKEQVGVRYFTKSGIVHTITTNEIVVQTKVQNRLVYRNFKHYDTNLKKNKVQ